MRPDHLRAVTGKVNQEYRSGPNRNSSSGVRNVSWCKTKRRWHVQISHNGRSINGGYFDSIEDATHAAEALRSKHHEPPPERMI